MADAGANQTTVIGADTHIKGEMSFQSSAMVLGTFEGKIAAAGEVHVGEGATCRAQIDATKVSVDGLVEGNVSAREAIQLNAKAKVQGDLAGATLIVAAGATFIGHCRVGPGAANTAPVASSATPAANGTTRTLESTEPKLVRPSRSHETPAELREETTIVATPSSRPLWTGGNGNGNARIA